MVGIVIVSHSHRIAEGVAELAREMGGPDVRLETAGGLALPDHPIGTDAVLVMEAIERAWSDDGVLVLMDLGSAVLSAEMALELLPEEHRANVLLCEAPIVEGAVAAAVTAKLGAPLERVANEARGGLAGKIAHLGDTPTVDEAASIDGLDQGLSVRFAVSAQHGLHARPAARFVQTASLFDARVQVRDLTNGRGPADAASLNAVAMLGATQGHEIEVTASGPQAAAVIAAIEALASRNFDDRPEPTTAAIGDLADVTSPPNDGVLRGHPASSGIAIGPARRFVVPELPIPDDEADDPDPRARGPRRRARGRDERCRTPARHGRRTRGNRRGGDLRRPPALPAGRDAPRTCASRDHGGRTIRRRRMARRDRADGRGLGRAGRSDTSARARPISAASGDKSLPTSWASRHLAPRSRRPVC